jgi:hypothetical protein
MRRATACALALAAVLTAAALGSPGAYAAPTVTELTGGASGFTANRQPLGITTGPDGNV